MGKAWVSALRMLAARRLTESQLWNKLEQKGYPIEEIGTVIERAKAAKFLDDRLFATLYIDVNAKLVGDRRLIADLVKRGIDRDLARATLEESNSPEEERLAAAYAKLARTRSQLSMPTAARALERKGFAVPAIYQFLRAQAAGAFTDQSDSRISFEDSL